MTQRRLWFLGATALALAAFAVLGMNLTDPGHQAPAGLAWLAVMVLFELPAVWWRMRGGSLLATFGIAVLCPLSIFEAMLLPSYLKYRHGGGGDLQGIEALLMIYVVPAAVLVTAAPVSFLAGVLIRPEPSDE